jgi:hypothetical protein
MMTKRYSVYWRVAMRRAADETEDEDVALHDGVVKKYSRCYPQSSRRRGFTQMQLDKYGETPIAHIFSLESQALCRLRGIESCGHLRYALGAAFVDRVPISWLEDNEEAAFAACLPVRRVWVPPYERAFNYRATVRRVDGFGRYTNFW